MSLMIKIFYLVDKMKNICCTKPTNRHKMPRKPKKITINLYYETVSVISRKSEKYLAKLLYSVKKRVLE